MRSNGPDRVIARRPDRAPRTAGALRVGDYVHDPLVPMRVVRFEDSPAHVVVMVGRTAPGTEMTVHYPAGRELDVTRMVPTTPPAAIRRRGHLSLVHSANAEGAR